MPIDKNILGQGGGPQILKPKPTPTPVNKDLLLADATEPNTKNVQTPKAPAGTAVKELSAEEIQAGVGINPNSFGTPGGPVAGTNDGDPVVGSKIPENWIPEDGSEYVAGQSTATEQAAKEAELKLKSDLEQVKESQLGARKNIESNAGEATQNYALLKYSNNQTAEKMGWTGGAYTDLKSMEQYIKATIAADMYGQVELLKFGYKTELAKAIAAKEANMAALEYQYVQEAFQNNLAVSQQTGVWVHPIIENDLGQLEIAQSVLEEIGNKPEDTWTTEERANYSRAQGVYNAINERYLNSETPLSEQGLIALKDYFKEQNYYSDVTLTALQMESLKIETDNAEKLANQSYSATEFENGRVVDAQGNLIVDLNSNNYTEIETYFNENPGQWKEWMLNKFEIPVQASFKEFRTNNPESSIDTVEEYIEENPELIEDAIAFTQNAGQESFLIGNKKYTVGDGSISMPGTNDTVSKEIDEDDNGLEDTIDKEIFNDPDKVIADTPDPLGLGEVTAKDILDIYSRGNNNITQTEATTQYVIDMNAIDKLTSGTYTQEEAKIAADAIIKWQSIAAQDMTKKELKAYKDNKYPENAFVTEKLWEVVVEKAGFKSSDFDWDWDIVTGDDATPGIKADSLSGAEAAFLESLGFTKAERGRFLFINGTGDYYYTIGTGTEGSVTGLASPNNWYTKAFTRYLVSKGTVLPEDIQAGVGFNADSFGTPGGMTQAQIDALKKRDDDKKKSLEVPD